MSKKSREHRQTKRRRPRRRRRPVPGLPAPSAAERLLLDLARALPASAPEAVRAIADAWGPDAELPRAFARAYADGRLDKTRALALGWAREQVRVALEETLGSRRERATLAWLLLAGCEALAHEPPAAVGDRVPVLLALLEGAR